MAARKLEFGKGVVVIPLSLVASVEREVEAKDPAVFVVYPDDQDLPSILAETAKLTTAADQLDE